jgi:hypothetical protein
MAWYTTRELHDSKYQKNYCMPYEDIEELVEELRPFLESEHENLVNVEIEIRKVVHMVIYQLANGFGYRHTGDRYGIGPATIWKYVQIVVNILSNAIMFSIYNKYISILQGNTYKP